MGRNAKRKARERAPALDDAKRPPAKSAGGLALRIAGVALLVGVALLAGIGFGIGYLDLAASRKPPPTPGDGVGAMPMSEPFGVSGRIEQDKRMNGLVWPGMTLRRDKGTESRSEVSLAFHEGAPESLLERFSAEAAAVGWVEVSGDGGRRRVFQRGGDIRVLVVERVGDGICSVAMYDGAMALRN